MKIYQVMVRVLILAAMLLLVAGASSLLADEAKAKKGVRAKVNESAAQGESAGQGPSAEQDPRAVVKQGMLFRRDKDKVTLMDETSHRKASYRLEEEFKTYFEEQEIPLELIPPHSIVKFVLIDGQVREIILLQRSS